jgi:hypothetical protein
MEKEKKNHIERTAKAKKAAFVVYFFFIYSYFFSSAHGMMRTTY